MPKILIVEDDESMGAALKDGFAYEGYDVVFAVDGVTALQHARDQSPDLIILDVMLPKMSGLDVCKEIRATGSAVPVIMLTARGQEIDKVLGLKLGADDYVTKPFGFMELMARVEALLRRASGKSGRAESARFGDVVADFARGEVRRKGKLLEMSARELKLLQYLIEHKGEVIPRDRLLDEVWGYDEAPLTRTVDMHVAKLRKKVEAKPHDPQFILTIHGLGYKFNG
ncbi:MAG TPA: response regulator transcription factor [Candidatus Polarisedimenticolia bacterium]|nr:response regulator transcription factor [Candidatus Polarisedimenticolia bacterium]